MIDQAWVTRYLNHETVRWLDEGDLLVHEGRPDQIHCTLDEDELREWATEFAEGSRTVFATPLCFLMSNMPTKAQGVGLAVESPVTCLKCIAAR